VPLNLYQYAWDRGAPAPTLPGGVMKDLNDATEKICQLFGMVMAQECVSMALLRTLPPGARELAQAELRKEMGAARILLRNAQVSELTLAAFEERQRAVEKLWSFPPAAAAADS
jgi:hypothetical protein